MRTCTQGQMDSANRVDKACASGRNLAGFEEPWPWNSHVSGITLERGSMRSSIGTLRVHSTQRSELNIAEHRRRGDRKKGGGAWLRRRLSQHEFARKVKPRPDRLP